MGKRVLLVGSAISAVPKPARVPSVGQFKEAVYNWLRDSLQPLTTSEGATRVESGPDFLAFLNRKRERANYAYSVAFEALVGAIWDTDKNIAFQLLDACRVVLPNTNHRAIARLFATGHWHTVYTTNFDELIEVAVQKLSGGPCARCYMPYESDPVSLNVPLAHPAVQWADPVSGRSIVKLHGTISRVRTLDDIRRIVTRYDEVARPFPDTLMRQMVEDLSKRELFVVGYSGSDLDIKDALRKINAESHTLILWFDRGTSKSKKRTPIEESHYRGRSHFLEALNGESFQTDLDSPDPDKNILLRSVGADFIAQWNSESTPADLVYGRVRMGKPDREKAIVLLGRILELCSSPYVLPVLNSVALADNAVRAELHAIAMQGYLHSGRFLEFADSVSDPRGLPPEIASDITAYRAFAYLMCCTHTPWRVLLKPSVLCFCKLAHEELGAKLNEPLPWPKSDPRNRGYVYGKLIFAHYCNRLLRHNRIAASVLHDLGETLGQEINSNFVVGLCQTAAKEFRTMGRLLDSLHAHRESFQCEVYGFTQSAQPHESVVGQLRELETEYSIMGSEPGAVNVLRDMAAFELRQGQLGKSVKFAIEATRRAANIPGHWFDVSKGIILLGATIIPGIWRSVWKKLHRAGVFVLQRNR